MPCAALLPKMRSQPLVDFLFTEAVERAGSLSCRNPPGQAPCARGQESRPAGSGGPGPQPAPQCLVSCSFHSAKAPCSITTAGKCCLSSSQSRSPLGDCEEDKPRCK